MSRAACSRSRSIVSLALVALLAVACGGDGGSTSTAGPSDPEESTPVVEVTEVSIAIPVPVAAYLLPMYAQQEGHFAAHGIEADVKIIPPPGVLNLMVAGRQDFGIFSGPTVENAAVQGSDLSWISTYISEPLVSFMARPEITDIEGLRGKTIAITTPGSLSEFMAREVLQENGIDPDEDVQIRVVAGQSASRDALIAGQVDAVVLGSPDDVLAEQRGMNVLQDLRGGDYTWPFAGLMTRASYAEDNPEVVTRVLRGMNDAVDAWRDDPETVQALITEVTGVDAATAERSWMEVSEAFNDDNLPDPDASAVVLRALTSRDPKAGEVSPEDVTLPTYAESAAE